MTMTDPIADMLTRLRNGNSAFHDEVRMPASKLKAHIAEILKQEGYIAGFHVADAPEGRSAGCSRFDLKYRTEPRGGASPAYDGFKAGSARLRQVDGLPRVLGGLGTAIMSTSSGLLTDRQAAKREWAGKSSPHLVSERMNILQSRCWRVWSSE